MQSLQCLEDWIGTSNRQLAHTSHSIGISSVSFADRQRKFVVSCTPIFCHWGNLSLHSTNNKTVPSPIRDINMQVVDFLIFNFLKFPLVSCLKHVSEPQSPHSAFALFSSLSRSPGPFRCALFRSYFRPFPGPSPSFPLSTGHSACPSMY